MTIRLGAAALIGGCILAACGSGGGSSADASSSGSAPKPPPPPPVAAQARTPFSDATSASGIDYGVGLRNPIYPGDNDPYANYVTRFASSGGAAGDYDNDGDIDLFITHGDIGSNRLYENDGFGVFRDVAASAGVAYTHPDTAENYRPGSPAFADMDGDGDLDLFIGGLWGDPVFLFANNGDGTFSDVTAGSGLDTLKSRYNLGAGFGDYDLDGDLDLFITHFGVQHDMEFPGDTEHLWQNVSSGGVIRFTSVSVQARISPSIINLYDPRRILDGDFTFTPTFARIDDDLYPDLLVTADANLTQVFMNTGYGTFDNATDVDVIIDHAGMGSAVGDYDNDGDLDWLVTSIGGEEFDDPQRPIGNRFYRNDNGTFVDATDETGLASGGWGWGACFLDIENDGDLDIYHTNGWNDELGLYVDDTSRVFVNDGSGHFTNRAAEYGLDDTEQGRGVVCADFDNDGDIDIFQLHEGSPVAGTLWRNETTGNNYLRVKLNGLPPNTEAAGARLFITIGARTQMREIMIGNNFLSQNPPIQVIGLGVSSQADELRVEWPDGLETTLAGVAANQTLIIDHPSL